MTIHFKRHYVKEGQIDNNRHLPHCKECLSQSSNNNETNLTSSHDDVMDSKESIGYKWNEVINLNYIGNNCFDDIHIKMLQFDYIEREDREEDVTNAIQLVVQNENKWNIIK